MSGSTFNWIGGADIDGANNWVTPANWIVDGLPTTTFPNSPADTATINLDDGLKDAIISGGQSIVVANLTIGGTTVGAVQGGHVVVGGSSGPNGVSGGGGGTLTSLGAITVTSTNSGGAIVGGNNGVIVAPSMTVNGGDSVLIGGGGTIDVPSLLNNGGILADGGFFDLGPLVVNSDTISGTGFVEVSGPSILEINAATAQEVRVAVDPGQTASVLLDKPANFTGSLNLLSPNSNVDLFFAGETPTSITYNTDSRALIITGANGTVLHTIPFISNGVVPLSVVPSTRAGYGEVSIGVPASPILPGIPAPDANGISTTTLSSLDLSRQLQGNQSSMRFIAGTEAVVVVDGTLSVGADTNEAFVTRLYNGLLGRAPDANGLSSWTAVLPNSSEAAVAQSFLDSGEYQATNLGQDDNTFVSSLYNSMLGRPADVDGLAAWNQALADGASRGQVAASFADSAEAKQHWSAATSAGVFSHTLDGAIVREDYETAFGRDADTPGLTSWTAFLNDGGTPNQLAQDLAASSEFANLHGAQMDSDYVNALYTNGLGRAADPAGSAGWVSALQTGALTRGDVLAGIAQSAEGQQHLQFSLTT